MFARSTPPLLIAALLLSAGSVFAQGADRVVTGRVVDATTGEPIDVAAVLLEPAPSGVLTPRGASRSLQAARSVTTDASGRYTFRDLAPGTYRLHVTRYAYRPTTVDVEVTRPKRADVSIGLVVDPVAMEPLEAVIPNPVPFALVDDDRGEDDAARVRLVRQRQERFLPSDVRGLTDADLAESVTLAETDLFRAFQRFPGVTTRDDYTAELWARGAPWSHTRVQFDGLPLFNPLHGAGVFSAVHPDAVGGAYFFPGARPASLGEGAAAVLDLVSRPAGTAGEVHGSADLSLVSARAALERGDGEWGWRITGRRSWIDLATWAIEALGAGDDVYVPYSFQDVTGRVDVDLDGDRSLVVSGLWETDDVRGDVVDVLEENPSRWGNVAGRVTFETPLGGLRARHTIGATRFSARGLGDRIDIPAQAQDPSERTPEDAPIDIDHALLWTTLATELAPAAADVDERWRAGASAVLQRQRYAGPSPTPHPGRTTLDSVSVRGELAHVAVWGERRWTLTDRLRIDAGARMETGGDFEHESALRFAPRFAARWKVPGEAATLSAGWARTWQYAQVLSPAGLSVGPRLHPNELWFLAGDSIPPLRADVVTIGAETWLGERWLLSTTGWVRQTNGMLLPDPAPGPIEGAGSIVVGENRASGLEIGLRRLVGPWTASIAYTLGRSEIEADGRTYPASTERRHVLDVLGSVRVDPSLRIGAALTVATGAPYTRFFPAVFECPGQGRPCEIEVPAHVEEPNAERGPAYASLDLTVDWTRAYDDWSLGVFGQLRNALNRENALTYEGSQTCEQRGNLPCGPSGFVDEFERGLPILPTVGVRVVF